jgi:hypothetical protein
MVPVVEHFPRKHKALISIYAFKRNIKKHKETHPQTGCRQQNLLFSSNVVVI